MKIRIVIFSLFSLLLVQTTSAMEADKILNIGGAKIEIFFSPGVAEKDYKLKRPQVIAWVESSAKAVANYFTRFPVKKLKLSITDGAGRRVNGVAYNGTEPLIMININSSFDQSILDEDWVMVHEMVHLSFPPIKRRHQWLTEGLATYIEPLVRVRAGLTTEEKVWEWLLKGTPQGLPESGNQGLDNTPTWGQTYWGGAIFFLIADKQIHQQTNNKYGIEHALRAIQLSGGMQQEKRWDVVEALRMGDKATGTKVLETLYNEMKDKAVMTDLDAIWKEYGVSLKNRKIVFDDAAKATALRQSIINE